MLNTLQTFSMSPLKTSFCSVILITIYINDWQLHNTCILYYCPGLIILNAWYGKFVSETSQKQEKAKVIDVTVPLQCLVKDSKLILTESSKVSVSVSTFIEG